MKLYIMNLVIRICRQLNNNSHDYFWFQINWIMIFNKVFRKVGIVVNENDDVFVKNKIYFRELYNILEGTRNKVIGINRMDTKIERNKQDEIIYYFSFFLGFAIVMKAILENLQYIDWTVAKDLFSSPDYLSDR